MCVRMRIRYGPAAVTNTDGSQGEKVYLLSFRGFQSSMAGVCGEIEFRAFGRAVSYLND